MDKENRRWVEEVVSATSALALWIAGEVEPSKPEVLVRDVRIVANFVEELLEKLASSTAPRH